MSFSRRKNDIDTPSKFWCAVPECVSDGRKKGNLEKYHWMQGVEFFPFPTEKKESKLRSRWLKQINREDFEPRRHHRVCSLHFIDGHPTDQNPLPTLFHRNHYKQPLKERALTSIQKRQLYPEPKDEFCNEDKENQNNEVQFQEIYDSQLNSDVCCPVVKVVEVSTSWTTYSSGIDKCSTEEDSGGFHQYTTSGGAGGEHSYCYEDSFKDEVPELADASTQTTLLSIDITELQEQNLKLKNKLENKQETLRDCFVETVTRSDKTVKQYTGIPNKKLLNGIFTLLDKHESSLKYWSGKQSSKNMKYQETGGKPGPARKLTRYQEFILTLVRLRLGLMTFFLSDIFGVSESRVSQIFTTWITYMCSVFGPLIKWQSKEKNRKYMPKSFKKTFPRTRSIIDCTEMFIQRPRTPSAQSTTYSSYKHHNTFKALVSITPTGAFNFVSELWGGNTSDRFITENSGYLENIEPNDDVMADRGFVIRDLLTDKRATLTIPPFTHQCSWGKRKRLNVNEIKRTREIAKLRIHVERAIQRLKCFKMLAHIIPLKLKAICNQMLKVAAFLCNLDKPLVRK